jgi:hypothetical protein
MRINGNWPYQITWHRPLLVSAFRLGDNLGIHPMVNRPTNNLLTLLLVNLKEESGYGHYIGFHRTG